jgi:hypothetical protein
MFRHCGPCGRSTKQHRFNREDEQMIKSTSEGFYIEHNGDCWQSVFPSDLAEFSQLHTTMEDALGYMTAECNIPATLITVLNA